MFTPVLHMLACASHAGLPAKANWYPWSDRDYVGWRIQPHDGGEATYIYLVPDLDEANISCSIHIGPHGDPTQDDVYTHVEQEGES